MSKRNSTVKIVDGKVVFSQEIINYFENLRNEENSEWIDKYFGYLSDENNLTAEKYNGHHIIPCFVFKDKTHRTRKETEPLADKVEGNIIKLSIYNHLLAHRCLWKIFENIDSKISLQRMYGQKKYINTFNKRKRKKGASPLFFGGWSGGKNGTVRIQTGRRKTVCERAGHKNDFIKEYAAERHALNESGRAFITPAKEIKSIFFVFVMHLKVIQRYFFIYLKSHVTQHV